MVVDGAKDSVYDGGVGGMTAIVSHNMDHGRMDPAWTAAAISGEWLPSELMLLGSSLPLTMRQWPLLVLKYNYVVRA